MAAPKLEAEQRDALKEWLAAEYSPRLILHYFRERGWPEITPQGIHHYRESLRAEIEAARTERRSKALSTGLALKEERVERLKAHADRLEEIKWEPDEKGKLHNEKAWRETVNDIALEMGGRRMGLDLSGEVTLKRYEGVDLEEV